MVSPPNAYDAMITHKVETSKGTVVLQRLNYCSEKRESFSRLKLSYCRGVHRLCLLYRMRKFCLNFIYTRVLLFFFFFFKFSKHPLGFYEIFVSVPVCLTKCLSVFI